MESVKNMIPCVSEQVKRYDHYVVSHYTSPVPSPVQRYVSLHAFYRLRANVFCPVQAAFSVRFDRDQ